jgi:hypothetical protein
MFPIAFFSIYQTILGGSNPFSAVDRTMQSHFHSDYFSDAYWDLESKPRNFEFTFIMGLLVRLYLVALGGLVVSVLVIGRKIRGFKPGV